MSLEAQLEQATREFLTRVLTILRSASLAEVAAVNVGRSSGPSRPSPASAARPEPTFVRRRGPRPKTNSLDLEAKVLELLGQNGEPMAARALADRMGVPLDALAKPLKQLRDGGKIEKQGDKRATKYSLA